MAKPKKNSASLQSNQQSRGTKSRVVRQETHVQASYDGPIPPPAMLQQYNDVIPDAANRILRMAEQQVEHRQFLEKTVVVGDSKRADRGLWAGLFVTLSLVVGAVFLVYTGHDWAGVAIAGLDIVGLASVFVYGTLSRRSERMRKASQMGQVNRQRRS
ncbi:MAG: DUF2335 domain-containing protein [Chloroflexi bacterium]|nr:DUF2335 domain-containing protein [Chloroflexota bacterium]